MKPASWVVTCISSGEVFEFFDQANFGISKRDVVRQGLLKAASGLYQGHTSKEICLEHGLVTKKYNLTKKGRMYLWAAFNTNPMSV